ncbi:MAG: ssb [Gammaproteobacteria bacterium]|jgi:single-strand DNA-binding protein|nr:ssb [Gammaproteobacteria bacterium]
MMAKSINKVILIGYLGSDPELRATINGTYVTNASLATSTSWKDKQSGEIKNHTEWHKIVFYNKLAEMVGEYISKGDKIYVEGHLRTRKWQDQEGLTHYITEIIADEMQMLSNKTPAKNTHYATWYGKNQSNVGQHSTS